MDKKQEDQLVMCGRVVDFVTDNAAALAASEVATEQAATVGEVYAQLGAARGKATRSTEVLTTSAADARTALIDGLLAVLGPLRRVAARLGNDELLAVATLKGQQLRALRPQPLQGVAQTILDATTQPKVAPELARQGLTAAALQPVRDAFATHKQAAPATRKTIDRRTLANLSLDELLDELMDQVRQLDEDMKAFKLLNRPLYDGYRQARKIIKSGGGKGPDDTARGAQ